MGQVRSAHRHQVGSLAFVFACCRYSLGAAVTGQMPYEAALAHKVRHSVVARSCIDRARALLCRMWCSRWLSWRSRKSGASGAISAGTASAMQYCAGRAPRRLAVVYDEVRRRCWAERAAANDGTLDLMRETAELDKAALMRAEACCSALVRQCVWLRGLARQGNVRQH